MQAESLIKKIEVLPSQKSDEVAALGDFLARRESGQRRQRDEDLAAYLAQWAGTEEDLNPALEQAGIDCWLAIEERKDVVFCDY